MNIMIHNVNIVSPRIPWSKYLFNCAENHPAHYWDSINLVWYSQTSLDNHSIWERHILLAGTIRRLVCTGRQLKTVIVKQNSNKNGHYLAVTTRDQKQVHGYMCKYVTAMEHYFRWPMLWKGGHRSFTDGQASCVHRLDIAEKGMAFNTNTVCYRVLTRWLCWSHWLNILLTMCSMVWFSWMQSRVFEYFWAELWRGWCSYNWKLGNINLWSYSAGCCMSVSPYCMQAEFTAIIN